ncbi:MAG: ferredoxin [Actinomycetota bacterium]
MTYVIAEPCVDVLDRACVEECPVDCIYEGERALYINPDECVDCGACEPVCPVEAIYYEDDLPEKWSIYAGDNAAFFTETLPGRDAPLGSPGGAGPLGPLGVDTPLVAGLRRAKVT